MLTVRGSLPPILEVGLVDTIDVETGDDRVTGDLSSEGEKDGSGK